MHSRVYCIHADTLQQLGFILYLQPTEITDRDFTIWAAEHLGRRADEYEKDVFKIAEDGLSWDYKERDPTLAVSAYLQRCCKLLRNNGLSHLYDSNDHRLLCKVLRLNLPSNLSKEIKKYQDQIDPAVSRDVRVFQQVLIYILQKQSYGLALGEISAYKSRKDNKHKDGKDGKDRRNSRDDSRGRSRERKHSSSSMRQHSNSDRHSKSNERRSPFKRRSSDARSPHPRVRINSVANSVVTTASTPGHKPTWNDGKSPRTNWNSPGRAGATPGRMAHSPYSQPAPRTVPPLRTPDRKPAQQRNLSTASVDLAPDEFAHLRADSLTRATALPKVVTSHLDGSDAKSFLEYRPMQLLAFNALKDVDQARQKVIDQQIEHFSGHDKSILINKVLVGKYKLDNGADESILSRHHLNLLTAAGVKFETYSCAPCRVSLAFGKQEALISTAVKADFVLNSINGPISLRGVTALVIDEPMEHVLLGSPLLNTFLPNLEMELGKLATRMKEQAVQISHEIPAHGATSTKAITEIRIKIDAIRVSAAPSNKKDLITPIDIDTVSKALEKKHILQADIDAVSKVLEKIVDDVHKSEDNVPAEEPSTEDSPADIAAKVNFTSEFDTSEDPTLPSSPEVGEDDPDEVWTLLKEALQRAREAGLPDKHYHTLRKLIWEYRDVFSIRLKPGPPADVPAMKMKLKPDAIPKRCFPRKYSAHLSEYMNKMVAELEACGFIYRNSAATWASPMYPIPKPHQEGVPALQKKLRLVNDVRYPNSQCIRTMWPMPNFETLADRLRGSRYYFVLDLFKGYWQFPMDPLAQEVYSFMTDRGVYSSYRLIQGACDAVMYFQATIAFAFVQFYLIFLLIWLDDLFGLAKTFEQYFAVLTYVLQVCRERRIQLSAEKCVLFTMYAEWCGRIISHEGIRYNPEKLQGLIDLKDPRTAADLFEFVCAFGWMRSHIPDFAKLVEPLNTVVSEAFNLVKAATRKKERIKNVLLTRLTWAEEQVQCVRACKNELIRMMAMNFPDPRQSLCVFTDASLTHWGGILTQVPPEDMSLPFADQRHSPLGCVSGAFRESARHWPIIEKEAYAIVETISRFHYLTAQPQGFYIFCDHANLIYLFSPLPSSALLSKTTEAKLLRWRLSIASYYYVIEHIAGADNIWADLLSRWGGGSVLTTPSKILVNVITIEVDVVTRSNNKAIAPKDNSDRFTEVETTDSIVSKIITAPISQDNTTRISPEVPSQVALPTIANRDILKLPSPLQHEDFEAPTLEAVRAVQQETSAIKMKNLIQDNQGLFRDKEDRIVIPEEAEELKLRLIITAHCGAMGHRGVEPTYLRLKVVFNWKNMKEDVKQFIKNCIHCVANGGGNLTRVPLGHSIQGTRPNEVIHMDYVYICDNGYLLTIKDSFSKYLVHYYCTELSAAVTLQSVSHWISLFGLPTTWVSDQGSHFVNEVIKAFREYFKIKQHLTIAYCPWSNGVIERPHRDTLACLRKLRTELNLPPEEWIKLIPLLQFISNHTPVRSLDDYAPVTVFTGLQPTSTMDQFIHAQFPEINQKKLNFNAIKKHVHAMSKYLRNVHSCSFDAAEAIREASRNSKNNTVNPITLAIGDYVLRATDITVAKTKTYARWSGPYVIIETLGNHVFQLKDLVTKKEFPCHAARLRFYADSSLNVTEELIAYIVSAQQGFEIQRILDYYLGEDDQYYFSVRWFGFEADADTWEPLSVLLVDAPTILKKFVKTRKVSPKDREAIEASIRKGSIMPYRND